MEAIFQPEDESNNDKIQKLLADLKLYNLEIPDSVPRMCDNCGECEGEFMESGEMDPQTGYRDEMYLCEDCMRDWLYQGYN